MKKAEAYRLLLVEDDPNFGNVLSDYLRLHGHEVDLARNGREGLDMDCRLSIWRFWM